MFPKMYIWRQVFFYILKVSWRQIWNIKVIVSIMSALIFFMYVWKLDRQTYRENELLNTPKKMNRPSTVYGPPFLQIWMKSIKNFVRYSHIIILALPKMTLKASYRPQLLQKWWCLCIFLPCFLFYNHLWY